VRITANQPVAKLVVRLNEVTADGKSWNVSYGALNLTHRDGDENPTPLVPGRSYEVTVPCYFTAHRFAPGSQIRVALSESLWPMLWPSPQPVRLAITAGYSRLVLPVRASLADDPPMPIPVLHDRVERKVTGDPASLKNFRIIQTGPDPQGHITLHKVLRYPPQTLQDIGTTLTSGSDWIMSIREGDPNSCVWRMEWFQQYQRGNWDIITRSTMELSSTPTEFHLRESLQALEGEKLVFERSADNRIKRDCM